MKKDSEFSKNFEEVAPTKKELMELFSKDPGLLYTDYFRFIDSKGFDYLYRG